MRISNSFIMLNPFLFPTIWSIICLLVVGFLFFLLVRCFLRKTRIHKVKNSNVLVVILVSACIIQSCSIIPEPIKPLEGGNTFAKSTSVLHFSSSADVDAYMKRLAVSQAPQTNLSNISSKSHSLNQLSKAHKGGSFTNDFDATLPEVTVIGSSDISYQLYDYNGNYYGGGGPSANIPTRTGSGPPTPGPNNPTTQVNIAGRISTLRFRQGAINHIFNLKIEGGKVTNVTSSLSGFTFSGTYSQLDYVVVSQGNGVYTVDVVFQSSYALFIESLGQIWSGDNVHALVILDTNTGIATMKYHL